MDLWIERVAGIDVSKTDVKVCVRTPSLKRKGRRHTEVRTFSTMDRDLDAMAAWLHQLRVQLVVMESTGPYWKPVYYALERAGFCDGMPNPDDPADPPRVWLVNARAVKSVPGRKSDVIDCQWQAQLAEHG